MLWSFSCIIPLVYFLLVEANKPDYYQLDQYAYYKTPFYDWLRENQVNMISLNFIFSVVVLFFLARIIRNWKGIAED